MAGYLLTGNRSIFFHVEDALMWLFECQQNISFLYTHKEKRLDKIPTYYQVTICYIDIIGRPTYSFATEITCDANPGNIIALDPDGNGYYH